MDVNENKVRELKAENVKSKKTFGTQELHIKAVHSMSMGPRTKKEGLWAKASGDRQGCLLTFSSGSLSSAEKVTFTWREALSDLALCTFLAHLSSALLQPHWPPCLWSGSWLISQPSSFAHSMLLALLGRAIHFWPHLSFSILAVYKETKWILTLTTFLKNQRPIWAIGS